MTGRHSLWQAHTHMFFPAMCLNCAPELYDRVVTISGGSDRKTGDTVSRETCRVVNGVREAKSYIKHRNTLGIYD